MPTEVDAPEVYANSEDSLARYYPTFHRAELPTGSSALTAWAGNIQVFANDESAKYALRALDRDLTVFVDNGIVTVGPQADGVAAHALEPMLVGMCIRFHLLVLAFGQKQHPRVYCLKPLINAATCPTQPHLRRDQVIEFRGYSLPALCVYSAAEFIYSADTPRLVQLLDQASIFLAKHLIWTRTRRLFEIGTDKLVFAPAPGPIHIVTQRPYRRYVESPPPDFNKYWQGYWPGSTAASGFLGHINTIAPTAQCWCGSGDSYAMCHRLAEVAWLERRRVSLATEAPIFP